MSSNHPHMEVGDFEVGNSSPCPCSNLQRQDSSVDVAPDDDEPKQPILWRTQSLDEEAGWRRRMPMHESRDENQDNDSSVATALHSSFDASLLDDGESIFRSAGKHARNASSEEQDIVAPGTVRKLQRRSDLPPGPNKHTPGRHGHFLRKGSACAKSNMMLMGDRTPTSAARRRRNTHAQRRSPRLQSMSRFPPSATPFKFQETTTTTTSPATPRVSLFDTNTTMQPMTTNKPPLTPTRAFKAMTTVRKATCQTATTVNSSFDGGLNDDSHETASPTPFRFTSFPASLPRVNNTRNNRSSHAMTATFPPTTTRKRMTFSALAENDGKSSNSSSREEDATNNSSLSSLSAEAQQQRQQQQQQQEVVVASPPGVGNEELNAILASTISQEQDTPPPPAPQQVVYSWFQVLPTALGGLLWTIGQVATSLVIPQVEQQFVLDDELEEEVEVRQVTKPLLTRSYVWFLLFLGLQCFCCWESIILTVEETSNKSLHLLLRSIFPKKEQQQQQQQPVENNEVVVVPSDEQVQELESLSALLESAKHNAKFPEEMEFAKRQLIEIRGRLKEKGQAIDDWQGGLVDVESALHDLVISARDSASMEHVPRLFFRANEILGFFKDMVPPTLTAQLLDTTFVFLWETVSTTKCMQPNKVDSNDDPILTMEMWQMGKDELRQMILSSTSDVMSSEDASTNLRMWVRKAIPEPDTAQQKEMTPANGLTQAMTRDVITKVIEKERADQLGVVDYVSILAGASVIKRATSPSLVDSLPLLNRLMKHARLRFYGYGPEAALTPTFPVNALGQCWAFDRHPQRKGGRYATLTVQLGQPVHVTNVVVEHAPKELTNEPETAIQQFRILGYEDADATNEPWNLGSFQYDIDAPRMLQQFQVANHANGELIPKLQSIALAIDSNWGSNYSCLYRFRVLGSDEPSEDRIEAAIADDFDEEYNVDSESVNSIDAAQETTKNVEVAVESEGLHAKPDSSLPEEPAGDGEIEEVSEPDGDHKGIASKDAADTNVAAERVNNDKNEEEASKSTLPNKGGDSTNDSEDIPPEETSGSEHVLDSEDDSHAQPEPEDSHRANVADDVEQMANDVDYDTNEDNVEANDNEDVDDEEVHDWDNADRDSGDEDNASGDHADSQEQEREDDSRDGRYDSGDDSGDEEDHDSGDDSGDDEYASGDEEGEEYVHDEH